MIAAILIMCLVALVVGGAIYSGKGEPNQLEERCAWCDFERAVKSQPHYSHGICEKHKQQELAKIKQFPKSEMA